MITKTNVQAMLVEMVRPQVSRIAGISMGMSELRGIDSLTPMPQIYLYAPLFGGISLSVPIRFSDEDSVTSNGKQPQNDILLQLEHGITMLVERAELEALVDYRWPAA